jgi:hypothetical protein
MDLEYGQADDDETSSKRARFGHDFIIDVVNTDVLICRIGKHRAAAIRKRDRTYPRSIKTDRRVGCVGASAEIDRADLARP